MQHVTLTPAGLLIGVAVSDALSGDSSTDIDLDQTSYPSAGRTNKRDIWDGERLSAKFMDAVEAEVKNRAERRSGIWYEFTR